LVKVINLTPAQIDHIKWISLFIYLFFISFGVKETSKKGEPLVFIGGEADGTSIEEWPGMKPSDCWVDNGISQVLGERFFSH
jgi:hypothetical protein